MPAPRRYATAALRQAAYQKRKNAAREDELRAKGLPPMPLIPTMPGTRRWSLMLASARALVQGICDEREGYYDDRSEEWQDSDRGTDFQEQTEAIANALGALDDIGEE
jgi:hypothetical protein